MKIITSYLLLSTFMFFGFSANAQDKPKPSPAAEVTQTIASGATIKINYSQPSVKGRTIGVDLEPKEGQVWRTGANDATVFETDKSLIINGNELNTGKYSLFTISGKDSWTIIFNNTWKQWGAFKYSQDNDALRITVKPQKAEPFAEKMTFTIDEKGEVVLLWGDYKIAFTVK